MVLVPFEREHKYVRMQDLIHHPPRKPRTPDVRDRVTESDEQVEHTSVSTDQARTSVKQCLEELIRDALTMMQDPDDHKDVTHLRDDITKLLSAPDADIVTRWSDLSQVAVIGPAGVGKSYLLNTMLAVTEVPTFAYGKEVIEWHSAQPPRAEDASRIAAMLICRDLSAEAVDKDWVAVDEDLEQKTEEIMTPDGEPFPGDRTRRLYRSKNPWVVHELPSGEPREGIDPPSDYIFDRKGHLNPSFEDVGGGSKSSKPLSYVGSHPFCSSISCF